MNPSYFVAYLLTLGSGLYLTGIMAISPIYFMFVISLVTALIFSNKVIYVNSSVGLFYFVLLLSFFLFAFHLLDGSDAVREGLGFVFTFGYFFIAHIAVRKCSKGELINLTNVLAKLSILMGTCDAIYRFLNPAKFKIDEGTFHIFKENSLMFEDSNFTAFFLLSNFLLYSIVMRRNPKFSIFIVFCFLLVILACLSRAAALGVVVFWIIRYFIDVNYQVKFLILIGSFVIAPTLLFYILSANESLLSDAVFKLEIIIGSISNLLSLANIQTIFFGHGFASSSSISGYSSHNFLIEVLYDVGLVGLACFAIPTLVLAYVDKRAFALFCVPLFVVSMSFGPLIVPYTYLSLALLLSYSVACKRMILGGTMKGDHLA